MTAMAMQTKRIKRNRSYKWCFVPMCISTSLSTPDKLFVNVPRDTSRRKAWVKAARRDDTLSLTSALYCCEDHFNMEDDMDNYLRFKIMGGNLRSKKTAVPHIFICQQQRNAKDVELEDAENISVSCQTNPVYMTCKLIKRLKFLSKGATCRPRDLINNPLKPIHISLLKIVPLKIQLSPVKIPTEVARLNLDDVFTDTSADVNTTDTDTDIKQQIDMEVTIKEEQFQDSSVENFGNSDYFYAAVKEEPFDDNLLDVGSVKIEEHNVEEFIKINIKTEADETKGNSLEFNEVHNSDECDLKSSIRANLVAHVTHASKKLFKCSKCEYASVQEAALQRHELIHTDKTFFQCYNCDYRSLTNTNLRLHMLTHRSAKPHQCTICNNQFMQKSSLNRHMLTHTGEKPHHCSICKYKCSEKYKLTKHMRTHIDKKPHKCAICEYKCSEKFMLEKHIDFTHTGEKPHQCSICEFKCSVKLILNLHMLTQHNVPREET